MTINKETSQSMYTTEDLVPVDLYTLEILGSDEANFPEIYPDEDYDMSRAEGEACLDMDEESLYHFLSYSFVFFIGWIISGLF